MHDVTPPFHDPGVEAAFLDFPAVARPHLLAIRTLIFDVAAEKPAVGPIQEALRWGQPAYLTAQTRSGSTLRLGIPKAGGFALYVHCRTDLLSVFRDRFPDDFTYEGNRAVRFEDDDQPCLDKLRYLVAAALTHHLPTRR